MLFLNTFLFATILIVGKIIPKSEGKTGYVLIEAINGCSHAKDDADSGYYDITSCINTNLTHKASDCEEYCSTRQSCVGYEYEFFRGKKSFICQLYPSNESCPSEFELFRNNYTAKSSYDLVPGHELQGADKIPGAYSMCYAKKPVLPRSRILTADIELSMKGHENKINIVIQKLEEDPDE